MRRADRESSDDATCIFGDQQNERQTPQWAFCSATPFPRVIKDMSDCQRGLAEMGERMFQKSFFCVKDNFVYHTPLATHGFSPNY